MKGSGIWTYEPFHIFDSPASKERKAVVSANMGIQTAFSDDSQYRTSDMRFVHQFCYYDSFLEFNLLYQPNRPRAPGIHSEFLASICYP